MNRDETDSHGWILRKDWYDQEGFMRKEKNLVNELQKKISVIIPVYNVEKYLPDCLESVINQTYKNLEIILIDDGSTDESGQICDYYALENDNIHVIHKKNGGLVSARKAGLLAAHGEYVSCVDSDDWIEPDMIERLMNIEDNTQADIIAFAGYEECGDYQGLKKNTIAEGLYRGEEQLGNLYGKMIMNEIFFEHGISTSIWNKFFKKGVLEEHQMNVPNDVSYGEDTACVYPCMLSADSIYVTNIPLYHYRVRQGSIVRSEKVSSENFEKLYRTLKLCFDAHTKKKILNVQLNYYMWQAVFLKGYEKIHDYMPLFPFEKVKSGMKIAIHGAGLFGQVIRGYCTLSDELSVVGWFDKHYEIYVKQDYPVKAQDDAADMDFDIMVIAILNSRIAEQIKKMYAVQGIPEWKIDMVNMQVLDRYSLPQFDNGG